MRYCKSCVNYLLLLLLLSNEAIMMSSSTTPTSAASASLPSSTASMHSPLAIDPITSTTSSLSTSAAPTKKKRKRRRKRRREGNTSTDANYIEDDDDEGLVADEGYHSSMPPFAVRHDLVVESYRRKRRKRRTSQTSSPGTILLVESSSSYSSSSKTTTTTFSTTTSTRERAAADKDDIINNEGETIISIPEVIATVIKNNEVSFATKRQRTKANRIAVGRTSDTLNRSKTRSARGGSGGKDGECLRRIKREWKDAVKMGIAYDWMNMRTINNQRSSSTHSNCSSNNDHENTSSYNNYIRIGPYGKNLLRWHFSVAGPVNSVYAHGIYHGAILLPRDYPASPPRVRLLTPSGRFIVDVDICLTASNYHPESWTPRWTVLSLVQALRVHMLTSPSEIGGLHASEEKRREYAMASREWRSKDGVVDHGRMVAIGVFPPPLIDDIDNSIAPVEDTEQNIIEEYQDDASLRINGDKDDDGNEQQGEAIFDRVMRLRSVSTSSSSLGRNALDIITYSSEEETVELVQVKAKTIGIEHVQRDRNYRSHKIVRSKAEKNATMTIASANFESKRTTRKEESTRHVNVVKEREQRGILIIVLKRITLELIKLPLRILSIMLMIIGGLLGLI